MRTHALPHSRRTQVGASLLEVLIAVLILAIGLLGIAALQSLTLKNTQSASERTAAIIQSYAMLDMMRANRPQAIARLYDTGWLCEAPEDPAASRIAGDTARWIGQLQQSVGPTACGRIDCGAVTCIIGVRWNDERGTGGDAVQEIATQTRL
ncbi:type IV pilus modification protein PilV [Arenimonas caeni]|jgi:type IV pilus assembly protein PilV|uniref:type IV pilus modification protein PilV n=1 Tax=Arenimonas caeni TaxID=2058085 RepID=UPI002A362857|nr:type IV pilus modification protein PilV [Arenimonas caeni]MDY0021618.1 type IV pilus modification protein PilV [Arenimonas caeni]